MLRRNRDHAVGCLYTPGRAGRTAAELSHEHARQTAAGKPDAGGDGIGKVRPASVPATHGLDVERLRIHEKARQVECVASQRPHHASMLSRSHPRVSQRVDYRLNVQKRRSWNALANLARAGRGAGPEIDGKHGVVRVGIGEEMLGVGVPQSQRSLQQDMQSSLQRLPCKRRMAGVGRRHNDGVKVRTPQCDGRVVAPCRSAEGLGAGFGSCEIGIDHAINGYAGQRLERQSVGTAGLAVSDNGKPHAGIPGLRTVAFSLLARPA